MFRVVAFTASPRCCVHIHADQRNEPRWDFANARMPQEVHDASFSSSSRVYLRLLAWASSSIASGKLYALAFPWTRRCCGKCSRGVHLFLSCVQMTYDWPVLPISFSLSRPVLSFCLFASFPPVKHVPNAYFFVWTRCLFTSRVANWSSLNCQNKSNQNDFYSHE